MNALLSRDGVNQAQRDGSTPLCIYVCMYVYFIQVLSYFRFPRIFCLLFDTRAVARLDLYDHRLVIGH